MPDLIQRIKTFNADRLPEMTRYKYKFMAENMFRFFRGTCHLFYEDLVSANSLPSSPIGWISGDLHLENFGSFKSDNKQVYFDLNDFDEAILAPILWEPVRLIASIFIAFETLKIEERRAIKMATLFLKVYAATLQKGKPSYIESKTAKGIVSDFLTAVAKRKQKVILKKRTIERKNKLEIVADDPRHFKIESRLKKQLFKHIKEWIKTDGDSPYNYKVIDGVFRLAGTGSVGLKRYAFLLKTLNDEGEKYMLLDMKQTSQSALFPFSPAPQPEWESHSARVVNIQQRMQNRSPDLLSTSTFLGETYMMQEMQPSKDSINFRQLKNQYREMYRVIDDMAMLTASSQLRSTGQDGSATTDELKKFAQNDSWQAPLLDYALKYTKTIKENYTSYKAAYAIGEFKSAKKSMLKPVPAELPELTGSLP